MQDTADEVRKNCAYVQDKQSVFARDTFWMGSGDEGQAVTIISQPHWAFTAWSLALKNSSELECMKSRCKPWSGVYQSQPGTEEHIGSQILSTSTQGCIALVAGSTVHRIKIDPLIALKNTELCSMLAILLWKRCIW